MLTGGRFIYASALRLAVLKFILSMTVRALTFINVTFIDLKRYADTCELMQPWCRRWYSHMHNTYCRLLGVCWLLFTL